MPITAASLRAEYGAVYRPGSQSLKDLNSKLYRTEQATANTLAIRPTEATVYEGANSSIGEVLQSYQPLFTQKGDVTIDPNRILLYHQKIDVSLNPDEIEDTWAGFLANNNLDRKQWTATQWVLESHILPKKNEDFEEQAIFHGEYVAPTSGTPNPANKVMNGFNKIMTDGIAGNLIVTVPSGAWSTDPKTFVEQVEAWYASLPAKYRKRLKLLRMSEELELRYHTGREIKYNMYYAQATVLAQIKQFPNCSVIGLPSMNGSQRIWAATDGNAVLLYKRKTDGVIIKDSVTLRDGVDIKSDWWSGVGFYNYEETFCNELA